MKNIPTNLNGYELFVATKPQQAEYMDKETGELVQMFTHEDEPRPVFRLTLYAKNMAPNRFGQLDKGEEIDVNVPGINVDEIRKGTYVELIRPTYSAEAKKTKAGNVYLQERWNAAAVSPVVE